MFTPCVLYSTDAPLCFARHPLLPFPKKKLHLLPHTTDTTAIPTLTKLAAELVNMPIESVRNSTRQLRLSTWRRSVLKALSQASMTSNLCDILFKELDSNQHVLESLCAHAAKACTIPVLPSRDSDLDVLISQGRITMRRRQLLDDSKENESW